MNVTPAAHPFSLQGIVPGRKDKITVAVLLRDETSLNPLLMAMNDLPGSQLEKTPHTLTP